MDLKTRYLGLELKHPIVASPSPLTRDIDGIHQLIDADAAAIVTASIFEEAIEADRSTLDAHLKTLRQAASQREVPIIASLNGATPGDWVKFASELQDTGVAGIELDLFRVPSDIDETGEHLEQSYIDIVRSVKANLRIPLGVKLSPYFSSPANMAKKIVGAGADSLVLFNRFYGGDIDLDSMMVKPEYQLSTPYDIRLPLMWLSLLSGKLNCSLAATSGVWTYKEVVKYLMVGADAVMTTSSLLKLGPKNIGALRDGLREWMEAHGYDSIGALKGRFAVSNLEYPSAFVRNQYGDVLTSNDDGHR